MALKHHYSNNSGNPINIYIPECIYYLVTGPDAKFFGSEKISGFEAAAYHPGNQKIIFAYYPFQLNKDDSRTSAIFPGHEGATILFLPDSSITSARHGWIAYSGKIGEGILNGRKTRCITEKFDSSPIIR